MTKFERLINLACEPNEKGNMIADLKAFVKLFDSFDYGVIAKNFRDLQFKKEIYTFNKSQTTNF